MSLHFHWLQQINIEWQRYVNTAMYPPHGPPLLTLYLFNVHPSHSVYFFRWLFLVQIRVYTLRPLPLPSHSSIWFLLTYTAACTVAYCTYIETAGSNCKQPIFPVANILPQIYICLYVHVCMYIYICIAALSPQSSFVDLSHKVCNYRKLVVSYV